MYLSKSSSATFLSWPMAYTLAHRSNGEKDNITMNNETTIISFWDLNWNLFLLHVQLQSQLKVIWILIYLGLH